jgi:hypothetical protein
LRRAFRHNGSVKVFLSIILVFLSTLSLAAKKPVPATDPDYIFALAAAKHFLQAWETRDYETGVVMLTDAAKQNISETQLDEFFAAEGQGMRAFEVAHGKKLQSGEYDFPVALLGGKRRYSRLVVIKEGKNEWVIDRLP